MYFVRPILCECLPQWPARKKERVGFASCPPFVSIPHADLFAGGQKIKHTGHVYNIQDGKILISNVSFLYCLFSLREIFKSTVNAGCLQRVPSRSPPEWPLPTLWEPEVVYLEYVVFAPNQSFVSDGNLSYYSNRSLIDMFFGWSHYWMGRTKMVLWPHNKNNFV